MTEALCGRCSRPVGDNAFVCQLCADDLRRALREIATPASLSLLTRLLAPGESGGLPADPWSSPRGATGDLASELATTFSRQSRSGSSGGGRPAERPVPWDERAAEAERRLEVVLVGVARMVSEERGVGIG